MNPNQAVVPVRARSSHDRGFTLLEILVVVAIVLVGLAAAVPAIGSYIRNFRIREAQQQIVEEITKARIQAIKKNVNWGVVFVIGANNRSYAVILEDDQVPPIISTRQTLPALVGDVNQRLDRTAPGPGPVPLMSQLPPGIVFAAAAGQCPAAPGGFAPNDSGMRFDRLGAWCDPGSNGTTCPNLDLAVSLNLVDSNPAANPPGARVCVFHPQTGLSRWILVSPGGRIWVQK